MAHHGWVTVIKSASVTPDALKSPFGRLVPASNHTYNSHAISLLAGALGPLHRFDPASGKDANPAGFTFFGQFIDHDLTEFRVIGEENAILPQNPTLGQRQRVLQDGNPTTTNGRTGRLDLDSVYGLLGVPRDDLFDPSGLFIMQEKRDIVRNSPVGDGRLIADPRNDENKIVVQIHLLFERLHNLLHDVSQVQDKKKAGGETFLETRAQVEKIYRQIIIQDYLPRIVPISTMLLVLSHIKDGTALYSKMTRVVRDALIAIGLPPGDVSSSVGMPVEFSHAAFRMGHTQLRSGYRLNTATALPLFATGVGDQDLRGGEPITEALKINWRHFFETDPAFPPEAGQPIDGFLPESVFRLPPPSVGEPPISLAERNVRRGVDFGLPSGQEALAMLSTVYGDLRAATFDELFPEGMRRAFKEILKVEPALVEATPLWYYVIREAERTKLPMLGPVGAHLVAETILGSLFVESDQADIARSDERLRRQLDDGHASRGPVTDPSDIVTMAQLVQFLEANGG